MIEPWLADDQVVYVDMDAKGRQHAPRQPVRPMIEDIEWYGEIEPALTSAYAVKGLLDQGAMSVIYGPSNTGKTFFAIDLAYHIAASIPWRQHRVDGGTVLYLAAEGGNGIANRLVALRQLHGDHGVPLALRRAGLDLLNPNADVERIISLAAELAHRGPLRLIVVDTLSRALAGGDENGPADMTSFVKNVDRVRQATGAHVMVVHHTGKDIAKGARGHSSLRAATDTEIEISVTDGVSKATVTKQRDHSSGGEYPFELKSLPLGADQDGDEVTSCVVVPTPVGAGDGLPSRAVCDRILKAIHEAWESGNPLSTASQSKHTGRYAARHLAEIFRLPERVVGKLLARWLGNAVIIVELHNSSTKRRGLKVIQWL